MEPTELSPDDWAAALEDTDGRQLVLAGPGTGKTEFLVRRVAALDAAGASPTSILPLTFSRRGAHRLGTRLAAASSGQAPIASTFHSLAYRLLERHGPGRWGWESMPSLMTGPEQVALVRRLLETEDPSGWPPPFRDIITSQTFAREVADFIMRSQEYLVTDDDLDRRTVERPEWRGLGRFRRRYLAELERLGRLDYGTLQARAVELADDEAVRAELASVFHHVLVDEYQDTTAAQARLVDAIVADHGNLTVAGDPTQSIYRFRGADPDNLARFADTAHRVWLLDRSFRCPVAVLDAAGAVAATAGVVPTPTRPAPGAGGAEAYAFSQASEEAEWIAAEIQAAHLTEGIPLERMAVLVRTKRSFVSELSRALDRRSIPHTRPDARLVDHPAVQMVFDIAFAAAHDRTDQVGIRDEVDRAVRRVLLGPAIGFTLGAERSLLRERRATGAPWSELLHRRPADTAIDTRPLAAVLTDGRWASELPAAEGLWTLWERLPDLRRTALDDTDAGHRRALAAFSQTLGRLQERDPATTLLAYRALAASDDFEAEPLISHAGDGARVLVTTLHQSKGLEFDTVFIADAAEEVFPDLRRHRSLLEPRRLGTSWTDDDATETDAQLREEARLAYTATTRASRRVVWSATTASLDFGEQRPSRFLGAVAGGAPGLPNLDGERRPVTYLDAEAHLRRRLADPAAAAGARLAAATVLVQRPNPGLRDPHTFAFVRPHGPDTGVVTPPVRLSASQAERYETCPRRYVLERRLSVDAQFGDYGTFGSLIHEVLEQAEKEALAAGRTRSTLSEAEAITDRLFAQTDLGVGFVRAAWRRRASELLQRLYADWPHPDAVPVALEHAFRFEFGGYEWSGKIDRIEAEGDRLRVVDYKTSATATPVKEAAASLQLGLYVLAVDADDTLPGRVAEAELWFPMAGNKPTVRSFDMKSLDQVGERLLAAAAGIESEDWTPRPSADCSRCSVRIVCPAFPEGREAFRR